MKPAFSVISFTSVAGAAQGLVVALAVSALTGVPLSAGFASAALLLALLMLAAGLGSEVEIETDGPDEQEAMQALRELIDAKFGEGQ